MGKPEQFANDFPATAPLVIEHVPIDRLRPDPANPRKISDAEPDRDRAACAQERDEGEGRVAEGQRQH